MCFWQEVMIGSELPWAWRGDASTHARRRLHVVERMVDVFMLAMACCGLVYQSVYEDW